jgi:basic membrane protein A
LLLVQAGASGTRPALAPTPSPAATATPACASVFHVAFVADVAGLRSTIDAAGWRGVNQAVGEAACASAELALPARPSEYRRVLQAYAGYDLVIAGSFLLTDPVVDIARANPATHFVLVDPIVTPPDVPNLAVLTFRSDQAAFLAGALAGILTGNGVVAGIYGPAGAIDQANRLGFERGARFVRRGVRVLGAYQPAGSAPYADPDWGATQATAFVRQHADVIFGAGGTTGQGALLGATQSGTFCINEGLAPSSEPSCVIATSVKFIDRGVKMTVADAIAGEWQSGVRSLGVAQRGVGLSLGNAPELTNDTRERIVTIANLLAAGTLTTGA